MFLRLLRRPHDILNKVVKSSHLQTKTNIIKNKRSNKLNRFKVTGEVLVSKIFPAGFCWQGSSVIAEQIGFTTDSLTFALTTGTGEALGVMVGHTFFYSMAKKLYRPQTNLQQERQTGLLLGSAAFCSGLLWQPTVNMCSSLDFNFLSSMSVTTLICGTSFYTGLRLSRKLYNKKFKYIENGIKKNSKKDAQLSLSIGGATGTFVGTDISIVNNWLSPLFGIQGTDSVLQSMITAGKSTIFGFGIVQTGQNIVTKDNWTDN